MAHGICHLNSTEITPIKILIVSHDDANIH